MRANHTFSVRLWVLLCQARLDYPMRKQVRYYSTVSSPFLLAYRLSKVGKAKYSAEDYKECSGFHVHIQ